VKAFLLALVAIAGISYGADYLLHKELRFSTADKASSDSVRLGN